MMKLIMMKQSTISPEEFRTVMRRWASSVAIVSVSHAGETHGMTVSSFTSVAAEPPLILVSLQTNSRTHKIALESRQFGVTILSESQHELSDRFAGRIPDNEDRFDGVQTETLISDAPFLVGGLAYLDCRVVHTYEAGTNTVFFAEVLAARVTGDGNPLLYFDRGYWHLQKLE